MECVVVIPIARDSPQSISVAIAITIALVATVAVAVAVPSGGVGNQNERNAHVVLESVQEEDPAEEQGRQRKELQHGAGTRVGGLRK